MKNTTQQLIDLLARNNRINLLDQVAEAYTSLLEKHQGKETAVVTTAVPLSSALEKIVLAKAKELSKAEISLNKQRGPFNCWWVYFTHWRFTIQRQCFQSIGAFKKRIDTKEL